MMVRRGNPLQSDYYSTRDSWHHSPQDGRLLSSTRSDSLHERCLTVEEALRNCAGIPVKAFALITMLENGEEKIYSSTSVDQDQVFSEPSRREFRRVVYRGGQRPFHNPINGHDSAYTSSEFELDSCHEGRKHSSSGGSTSERSRQRHQRQSNSEDSDAGSMKSKRKRARGYRNRLPDDLPLPITTVKNDELMIGNEEEVRKFYCTRFKDMQQSSCKVLGKAFVKLVEPKKQTNYPYIKGDAGAPPWWPSTPGQHYVRHKEPDHLLKPERIELLVHVLRMVVEPAQNQHLAIQKLCLNVRKLEEVTMEAMSNWFSDKEHPENATKKPFLKEIFKVARLEERFKAGEIDGGTYISVMSGEGHAATGSDDEDDEGVKDEDEQNDILNNIANGMNSSDDMVSPTMVPNQSDQESNSMFQNNHRSRAMSLRYASHPHMEDQPASFNDQASFPRGMSLGFQSPSPHDPSRRGFVSPVYQSPQNLYGWGSQNGNVVASVPVSSSYYTTSPQSSVGTSLGQYQLPPPTSQQGMLPPPMSHQFDGLPNSRNYDVGPALGNQLRTGSLGHPHQMSQNGFQDYLHDGNGFAHSDVELKGIQHLNHNER